MHFGPRHRSESQVQPGSQRSINAYVVVGGDTHTCRIMGAAIEVRYGIFSCRLVRLKSFGLCPLDYYKKLPQGIHYRVLCPRTRATQQIVVMMLNSQLPIKGNSLRHGRQLPKCIHVHMQHIFGPSSIFNSKSYLMHFSVCSYHSPARIPVAIKRAPWLCKRFKMTENSNIQDVQHYLSKRTGVGKEFLTILHNGRKVSTAASQVYTVVTNS